MTGKKTPTTTTTTFGSKANCDVLVVIDAQNDFITGRLGFCNAEIALKQMVEAVKRFTGHSMVFTRDTHEHYGTNGTVEEARLNIPHCRKDTAGWCIADALQMAWEAFAGNSCNRLEIQDKDRFMSFSLLDRLGSLTNDDSTIYICGLVTDICVVSNALAIRSRRPKNRIVCICDACAAVEAEKHQAALSVMRSCFIDTLGLDEICKEN